MKTAASHTALAETAGTIVDEALRVDIIWLASLASEDAGKGAADRVAAAARTEGKREAARSLARGALHALGRSDVDAAASFATQALEEDPGSEEALIDRFDLAVARNDIDRAIDALGQLASVEPRWSWPVAQRAKLYLGRGEPELAEADVRTALRLDPEEIETLAAHAELLVARKEWDAAVVATERLVAAEPEDRVARFLRAFALYGKERFQDAVDVVEQTRREHLDTPDLCLVGIDAQARLGRTEDARRALEELLASPRTPPQIARGARLRLDAFPPKPR